MTLRQSLLEWFDREKRDLPWRRTRDPYAIWVSEIMCQQTRVDTAVPYFHRFMERFPTTHALASASSDDVMSMWSGLGYYRRARLLHQGVKEVVETYGGQVPADQQERLSLPGVGRYTAGAIGSIAFDRAEPVVDGNVARVFSRLFLIDTPLGKSETERALWSRAEELVQGERPGDLNQSIMELGALICSPKSPKCLLCPVREHCGAHREGRVEELPVPKKKKPPVPTDLVAVVVKSARPKGVVLVQDQLPVFRGLWNPPFAFGRASVDAERALSEVGIQATLSPKPSARIQHVLSHRALDVRVYDAAQARLTKSTARRVAFAELASLGTSSLTRKILSHTLNSTR